MQTFLPYASFNLTTKCLDWRRLGKQRVECKQILNALIAQSGGWKNHPAVLMWKGFEEALKEYSNSMIREWIERGYNNNMELYPIKKANLIYPPWLGLDVFHASHRSNLLRKDPVHYGQFGWAEGPNLEYYWPTKEGIM